MRYKTEIEYAGSVESRLYNAVCCPKNDICCKARNNLIKNMKYMPLDNRKFIILALVKNEKNYKLPFSFFPFFKF